MKHIIAPTAAICLSAGMAFGAQISVEKTYSFHEETHAKRDMACIAAVRDHIAPEFRGLTGLRLDAPTLTETRLGALATYPGAVFLSIYEDTEDTISCVFSNADDVLTDVIVSFNGLGLGGFEKRGRIAPSSDPADWKVASYSKQIAP